MLSHSQLHRGFSGVAVARLVNSVILPSSASATTTTTTTTTRSPLFLHGRSFHATPTVNSSVKRRPLMERFDKRLLRAMTEPVYPQEVLYPVKVKSLTAYQQFRVEWLEYVKWLVDGVLERNQVFGFFFCSKPEDRREFNRMQQTFRKAGLMLQDWKAEDIRIVIEGTKYENVRTILNENVLFCYPYEHFRDGMPKDYVPPPKIDDVTAVAEMIRLGRVMPLINLLGGVVEDELMTRARMVQYTELGSIDSQRGQLCSILSSVPSTTSGLLCHHQNILGATLASYVAERTKLAEQTVEGGGGGAKEQTQPSAT